MTDDKPLSFAERRRKLAEERGRTLPEDPHKKPDLKLVPSAEKDLIPDVLPDRTEDDIQMDNIVESIGVLEAYRKWINKGVDESTTSKTEGIMVSCPLPDHPDKRPSAWLNSDKKTWYCGKCEDGGDVHDLAAIHFGYDRPGYKEGAEFHKLRRDMAESFGWRIKDVAGGQLIYREDEAVQSHDQPAHEASDGVAQQGDLEDSQADSGKAVEAPRQSGSEADASGVSAPAVGEPVLGEPVNNVRVLREEDVADVLADEVGYPTLNWKVLVPEDTFLYQYCLATSNDDAPEEYHFWHGLLALGHAVGRNVFLNDTRPVYGNLLVCLLGGTGYGKSRSRGWLDDVLEEVVPFRNNGLDTSGCKLVPVPASGENLIKQFEHIAYDPSLGKSAPTVHTPINGIVDYDEFASLLARAGRQGSTLKQIIMGFSDARSRVTTSSNTGGDLEAYKPFCSITASTQPKAVRKLLTSTDTGSGFLNRWIFVGGPRKQREVIGGSHSTIRVDLSEANEALKKVRGWGAKERDVRFSEDALDEFDRFMREDVFTVQMKDETDLLTRLDLTMKRLVLLFCINERLSEVTEEIVRRCEPLLEYLIQCYGILSAEIGISMMQEVTTEIMRHIKRVEEQTGRGASARDITMRMKRKNVSPDILKRALETMVALDWIDVDKSKGTVGRPTVRYKAVK